MSALNFLNQLEVENIQVMSINKPKDELTISNNEKNNEDTVRVTIRTTVEEKVGNVDIDFHLSDELKHITICATDFELMRRKVNPFQIKPFLIELFPIIQHLVDNDNTIIASDVTLNSFIIFLRRYSILLNFYHQ